MKEGQIFLFLFYTIERATYLPTTAVLLRLRRRRLRHSVLLSQFSFLYYQSGERISFCAECVRVCIPASCKCVSEIGRAATTKFFFSFTASPPPLKATNLYAFFGLFGILLPFFYFFKFKNSGRTDGDDYDDDDV